MLIIEDVKDSDILKAKLISVVMCVLNRPNELRQAIKSVIGQTFEDWELIIIDDGSTEDLKSVVAEFDDNRVLYHKLPVNKGIPHARNVGNSIASGDYIAVFDSDDIMFPERLQVQLDFMLQYPSIDVLYSSCWILTPDDLSQQPYLFEAHDWDLYRMIYIENLCFHSTVMFRKECLKSANYNEKYIYGSDYIFLATLAAKGHRFMKIKRPLIRYTRHNKSISRGHREEQTEMSQKGIKDMLIALQPGIIDGEIIKKRGVNTFDYPLSVVIPCYKNSLVLIKTLEGLKAQTCQDFEVILVDDGSPLEIFELAKRYSIDLDIQYYWNPDRGYTLCNVRNAGLKLAHGKIICFLDADVIPEKAFVTKVIALHNANSNLLAIHARNQVNDDGELIAGEDRQLNLKDQWRMMAGGNISIVASNAQMVGLFDQNYNLDWGLEDIDWALRAKELGIDVVYVPYIIGCHVGRKTFKSTGKNLIYHTQKWNDYKNI